jgi:inorganic pyrophosphatase
VWIITDEPLPTGIFLEAKIIGVMKFEDDGEVDDKVVVVPADDRNTGNGIQSLEDIPQLVKQIENHFNHYKDLKKPGTTIVKGWGGVEEAKAVIHESIKRWNEK